MKFKTFVIGYTLALALFLFAQRHPDASPSAGFRGVVDLTHTVNTNVPAHEASENPVYRVKNVASFETNGYRTREIFPSQNFGTHIDAPADFARGSWTVDQIPVQRLLAPLVVIDISHQAKGDPDYQLSVEDISNWEAEHGQIPQGAVVMADTGWESRWSIPNRYRNADSKGVMHFPGYSLDAAKFLVEARAVLGLGIDTPSIDYGQSRNFEVHRYTLNHGLYELENIANLDRAPAAGALVVAAPMKLQGRAGAPVRVMALLR